MNQAYYQNDGSIHCIGNGMLAIYEQGPNIIQIFGPPYSSPSYMQFSLCAEDGLFVISQREPQTAVWHHKLILRGKQIGEMIDFTIEGSPCFLRLVELLEPVDLRIDMEKNWQVSINGKRFGRQKVCAGFMAYADAGISVYEHVPYPSCRDIVHQVMMRGNIAMDDNLTVHAQPGHSVIYCVGGEDYPACVENAEWVLHQKPEKLLDKVRTCWREFSARRKDLEKKLPQNLPLREKVLSAVDDVSVLIKTQQSREGGILAGHNYHLAYVRDQYGASRCLLKLGYIKEAKKILEYYFRIYEKYGKIHNAQTMGDSHHFHIHENDNVEITGYLIIQAFDYYNASQDKDFLIRIMPMLEWAWFAQVEELKENMLPFNGDETYVAGGILPRTVLCEGSAESTLLFLTAGERLLKFVGNGGLWGSPMLYAQQELYHMVKTQYKERFYKNGDLITNRPFADENDQQRFLHGVCQKCGKFGWNELDISGYYLCRDCYGSPTEVKPLQRIYRIPSVKLTPVYLGSSIFGPGEERRMIEEFICSYPEQESRTVGYDKGMLLYALGRRNMPQAETIYREVLEQLDSVGGWAEYYYGRKPDGTRYRPWESGINLEAVLQYAAGYTAD